MHLTNIKVVYNTLIWINFTEKIQEKILLETVQTIIHASTGIHREKLLMSYLWTT